MRKLFLHIGPDKTGSSSIQKFFKNKKNYNKDNFEYIEISPKLYRFFGDKSRIHSYNKSKINNNRLKIIHKKLSILPDDFTYLISEEGLGNLTKIELIKLYNFLKPLFSKIVIIFVYRDPFSWYLSACSQRQKISRVDPGFDQSLFLLHRKNNPEILRNCISIFKKKNIKIIDFNNSGNKFLLNDFAKILKFEFNSLENVVKNIGLDHNQTICAYFLTRFAKKQNLVCFNFFKINFINCHYFKPSKINKRQISNIFIFLYYFRFFIEDKRFINKNFNIPLDIDVFTFFKLRPTNYLFVLLRAHLIYKEKFPDSFPYFYLMYLFLVYLFVNVASIFFYFLGLLFYIPIKLFILIKLKIT